MLFPTNKNDLQIFKVYYFIPNICEMNKKFKLFYVNLGSIF